MSKIDAQRVRVLWEKGRNYFNSFYTELSQVRAEIGNDTEFTKWCMMELRVSVGIISDMSAILKKVDAARVRSELASARATEQKQKAELRKAAQAARETARPPVHPPGAPIGQIAVYLDGLHVMKDDPHLFLEAHHYCAAKNEDLTQCVIFDGNTSDANLIGIEFIISERLFDGLPDEEKKLWHSHHYEVKSGELAIPGIPRLAEHAFMKDLITTYGKTWHTWQIDRDPNLPMGIPQLMMGFTADGQADDQIVRDRDRRLRLSSDENRKNRDDIKWPTVVAGANAWDSGKVMQLTLMEVPVRNRRA